MTRLIEYNLLGTPFRFPAVEPLELLSNDEQASISLR